MPDDTARRAAGLHQELALLERSVAYARSSLQLIQPRLMHVPTPCREWDLTTLLHHMDDSLRALQEAGETGQVLMLRQGETEAHHLVTSLKSRAGALLGAWTARHGADLVSVAGCPLAAQILVGTGALEIAVHGWDVAQACGSEQPIPAPLALALLPLVPVVVSDRDRGCRFDAAVPVPPWASPGDHLVAALGRPPWRAVDSATG